VKKKYLIRYNTNSTDDSNRWRIMDGEKEFLVTEINILVNSFTSKDQIVGVGTKFHIACEGVLMIENAVATIK
jgi:hypothetical protein